MKSYIRAEICHLTTTTPTKIFTSGILHRECQAWARFHLQAGQATLAALLIPKEVVAKIAGDRKW
ncbi:MAG: hypothetical protein CMI09_16420 [Oceanospirillaceae bacterium]|nr:hypothetical protein [Oceanospirillaceae bacterium]